MSRNPDPNRVEVDSGVSSLNAAYQRGLNRFADRVRALFPTQGNREAELIQLAQDRLIEANVWRGHLVVAEAEIARRVLLDERDLSALRFARELVRGVERSYTDDPTIGTLEGEATSDVLSALLVRAEAASPVERRG